MAQDSKVVSAANENRVVFKGTEDDARDYVERNFPRHHVDPAAPAMEAPEPDVYLVTGNGKKEMYLGPEEAEPWQAVKAASLTGGKVS
jgi:hypothetical protein